MQAITIADQLHIKILKEHVALDRTSWSVKSVCNRFFIKCIYGWKDVLKVEYNDPHKHASKLHAFPFALQTNTVGHFMESKTYHRPRQRVPLTLHLRSSVSLLK